MKKRMFLVAIAAMMAMTAGVMTSCGGDDDEMEVVSDLSQVVGTWVCTASTDAWNTDKGSGNADGVMVGVTLTIKQDGTYESSSYDFGRSGRWTVQGGTFSATSDLGRKMSGSIGVSGNTMHIKGSTTDGYRFDYRFAKQ